MSRGPEGNLKLRLVKYLKENNIYYETRQAGDRNYKKGIPDMWICVGNTHIEIELKREDGLGELSTLQLHYRLYFKKINVPCFVVESLDDLKAIIEFYQK